MFIFITLNASIRNPTSNIVARLLGFVLGIVESIRIRQEALVAGKVPVTGGECKQDGLNIRTGDFAGLRLLHLKVPATKITIVSGSSKTRNERENR